MVKTVTASDVAFETERIVNEVTEKPQSLAKAKKQLGLIDQKLKTVKGWLKDPTPGNVKRLDHFFGKA